MAEGRRKLAAIMSADVVGYSRLMAADEAGTVKVLQEYRAAIARVIERHQGRVVNAPGDNILSEFPSAVEAVEAAHEIQQVLKGRNLELAPEKRMDLRIGINLGDVIEEADGTIYGDGVNLAARMEALADAGGICISSSVYEAVEGKLELGFEFLGARQVKNIARPVNVYRVHTDRSPMPPSADAARRKPISARHALLAAAIAAAVIAGWFIISATGKHGDARSVDNVLAMPTGPTIAVLPFSNMSGDPKQGYFSDGITEQIITELTRFRTLHVLARNSTFQYKGQSVDIRRVGRELGARYVVEGSIRRSSDTIRVSAQLLDAESGAHLWAETFERELNANNIFNVQDEITRQIVAVIGDTYGVISSVAREGQSSRRSKSLDAYQCVLNAHQYYALNFTPQKHLEVRSCLERAVEVDPSYADAWSWLAAMYRDEHTLSFNSRPGALDRAVQAASRSIDLDSRNQEANLVLGHVYFFKGDLEAARVQSERAIALNPNSPDLVGALALTIFLSGDYERGVALAQKAIKLTRNPPGWMRYPILWNHYRLGRYEDALSEAFEARMPGFYYSHVYLAMIYGELGRTREAKSELDQLLALVLDFPKTPRKHLRWVGSGKFFDQVVDGLRKAGLDTMDLTTAEQN